MSPDTKVRLALLGGEGMGVQASPLWEEVLTALLPDGPARAAVVPSALAGQKVGTPERRAGLLADALTPHCRAVDVIPILTPEDGGNAAFVGSLEKADLIILPGGETRALVEVLRGSRAWDAITHAVRAGAALAAADGAAVGLGTFSYTPVKPVPGELAELAFEPLEGLGMVDNLVVLPFFNWLQAEVAGQLEALAPPGAVILGIDAGAAVVMHPTDWHVVGDGNVTIWQQGTTRQVIHPGEAVPTNLLSHTTVRT